VPLLATALAREASGSGNERFEPHVSGRRNAVDRRHAEEGRLRDPVGAAADVLIAAVAQLAVEREQHLLLVRRLAPGDDAEREIGRQLRRVTGDRDACRDEIGALRKRIGERHREQSGIVPWKGAGLSFGLAGRGLGRRRTFRRPR
jgi:hypothetical protein